MTQPDHSKRTNHKLIGLETTTGETTFPSDTHLLHSQPDRQIGIYYTEKFERGYFPTSVKWENGCICLGENPAWTVEWEVMLILLVELNKLRWKSDMNQYDTLWLCLRFSLGRRITWFTNEQMAIVIEKKILWKLGVNRLCGQSALFVWPKAIQLVASLVVALAESFRGGMFGRQIKSTHVVSTTVKEQDQKLVIKMTSSILYGNNEINLRHWLF